MEWYRGFTDARSRRTGAVFGALLAFAFSLGGEIYGQNTLAGLMDPGKAACCAALFAMVFTVASLAASILFKLPAALETRNLKSAPAFLGTGGGVALVALLMFLAWLPCLLAYWPGVFSYDIPTQTDYIATGRWTTQQPPIHTLIWAAMLVLEGFLGLRAITWYALFQMAFLAIAFSLTLGFLANRGTWRWVWLAGFLFLAANPVVALFAITPVKDAVLAGCLSLLMAQLFRLAQDPGGFLGSRPSCIALVALAVLCCLLRANMIVAFFLFAIFALVALPEARRGVAKLFGAAVLLVLLVVGPVYALVGITSGSSAIASIPFQQTVNVVRNHAGQLSPQELATVEAVLPVEKALDRYNPRFADSVVRLFKGRDEGMDAMRGPLMQLGLQWMRWSVAYPGDYLDAFLALNIPYWYPLAQTPDPYSKRAYIETGVWRETQNYAYEPGTLAPGLRAAYQSAADFSAFAGTPWEWLFSPATVVWMLLLSFFLLYNSHRRRNALAVLLPLLFWMSFLIGPVSIMRYEFPLFCLYPLLLAVALQPGKVMREPERS